MWVGGYFLGGWYLRYSMHVNVQKVCDNLTSWWAGCVGGMWVGEIQYAR